MHKMKYWLKSPSVLSHTSTSQLWVTQGDLALSFRGVHQGKSSIWWDTNCNSVSLLHLSIHYSSLHPSFLAVGHFFPSGTLLCIMQQGPYHSPVIDIPSPAKLIAGTLVKQPHETEEWGNGWWELSVHCMCKWASEREKQSKDRDKEGERRIHLSVTLLYEFCSFLKCSINSPVW